MNERGAVQKMADLLSARGVAVVKLLDQTRSGRDDRQMAFLPAGSPLLARPSQAAASLPNIPLSVAAFRRMTFPNQPYEEKKFL